MNPETDPERAILGCIIHAPHVLDELDLPADDFAGQNNRTLYRLITRMAREGETISPGTIVAALPSVRDDAPGLNAEVIADLYTSAPVPSLAGKFARIVTNAAGNRRLIAAGQRAVQLGTAGGDSQENQELIRAEIDTATRATADALFLGDTIDETIDALDKPSRAIPTPWPDLNRIIKGWRPGALHVIGARPGVGKTIMGLQAAIDMSQHGAVAFTSLEMPRRELQARIIAQTAEVALGRLDGTSDESTPLDERDWQRMAAARHRWAEMPLAIDDRSGATITDIRSHARSVHRRRPLAGIVVDYLQLLQAPRGGGNRARWEVVSEFSRQLKLLAGELDVPVIALAQLNRGTAKEDRRPTMADLRESGAIEQDSDVVILLHTPDEMSPDMDVMVAKNRHGVMGVVELTRRGEFARAEPRQWRPKIAPPPPDYANHY